MFIKKFIVALGSLLFLNIALADDVCHPTMDTHTQQYLIGYGSLMNTKSKNLTYPQAGPNIPVMIEGLKRGWFSTGAPVGFTTTFLGVILDPNSKINAAIFHLPADAIAKYDSREKNYCRVEVAPEKIHMLNMRILPKAQYWVYLSPPNQISLASEKAPIVQSYVDVFLSGCIEIQDKYHLRNFLNDCITQTTDWSEYWVNDRLYPRRPFASEPKAFVIDQALAKEVPKYFAKIKIE